MSWVHCLLGILVVGMSIVLTTVDPCLPPKDGKTVRINRRLNTVIIKLPTQFVNLVEHWSSDGDPDHPIAPDPLVLYVVLEGELRDLGADGVRVLHGAARSVRHSDWCADEQNQTKLCNNLVHFFVTYFDYVYNKFQNICELLLKLNYIFRQFRVIASK